MRCADRRGRDKGGEANEEASGTEFRCIEKKKNGRFGASDNDKFGTVFERRSVQTDWFFNIHRNNLPA